MGIPSLRFLLILLFAACMVASVHAAGGFQKSDCSCSLSGISAGTQTAGSTDLQCTWIKSSGSTKSPPQLITTVKKMPDKATSLQGMQESNAFNRQSTNDQKKRKGFSCVEEYYGDTKSSVVCGDTSFMGGRSIIYRDVYVIGISGGGFASGQELKGYFDKLEPCMKAAVDSHAGGQSGTVFAVKSTTTKPATTAKPVTTPAGTAGTGGPGSGAQESNPVSDAVGSAESMVQGGLTPLGQELMNQFNNLIGDLTGDKPVPPEVEEALAQAGIDCNEKDGKNRDKCFRDAALATGIPEFCLKMHKSQIDILKCWFDVAKSTMNQKVCDNFMRDKSSTYDYYREWCNTVLLQNAGDRSFCNGLEGLMKDKCLFFFSLKQKNGNTCFDITNERARDYCIYCDALGSGDQNLCETLDTEKDIGQCHEDMKSGKVCVYNPYGTVDVSYVRTCRQDGDEYSSGCSRG